MPSSTIFSYGSIALFFTALSINPLILDMNASKTFHVAADDEKPTLDNIKCSANTTDGRKHNLIADHITDKNNPIPQQNLSLIYVCRSAFESAKINIGNVKSLSYSINNGPTTIIKVLDDNGYKLASKSLDKASMSYKITN